MFKFGTKGKIKAAEQPTAQDDQLTSLLKSIAVSGSFESAQIATRIAEIAAKTQIAEIAAKKDYFVDLRKIEEALQIKATGNVSAKEEPAEIKASREELIHNQVLLIAEQKRLIEQQNEQLKDMAARLHVEKPSATH